MATYTRTFSDSERFPYLLTRDGVTTASTSTVRTLLGSRSGENVPDWRRKIRDGTNAASAYSSNRLSYLERTPGEAFLTAVPTLPAGPIKEEFSGYVSIPGAILPHLASTSSSAEAIALSQLYRKIEREQQAINSPAVIAEFGDVLRQFGRPFRGIVELTNNRINALARAKRGLRGNPTTRESAYSKIVADTYLEYAFGIAPLISDTATVAEAYARFENEWDLPFLAKSRVKGRGTTTTTDTSSGLGVISGSMFAYSLNTRTQTEVKAEVTVGLNNSVVAPFGSNERLMQILGFDPKNFVAAAWEVVPWSFLVDYFLNVGDILQAGFTNTSSVTWISKSVTYRSTHHVYSAIDPVASLARIKAFGYPTGWASGTCGETVTLRTTLTRSVPASLSLPALTFSIPSENLKWVNMAALLISSR